jgi:methyltransferase (TIGR00027 family)
MTTMDTLGLTSRWVAAARARETARSDRLFSDPLAAALAGDEGRAMLEEMERLSMVGHNHSPHFAIRTRFFDDQLLAETARGTRQIVLLAAGMDARAFRLDWPEGITVFEVERADVLAYKARVLEASRATPRARRVTVTADLREDWASALRKAGHDATKPSAFLVEGLLPYLPDETAAFGLFSTAASMAAPGSSIAMDLIGAGFLTSPFVKAHMDALAAKGIAWHFGTDEPEALLAGAGWADARVLLFGEPGASFGRWPFPVAPRSMQGVPHTFLVVAHRL